MNQLEKSLLGALMCSIALATWFLWPHSKLSVVSVDLARIKGQFIEQLARHGASPDVVRKASPRFNQKLQVVLNNYAKRSQVLIVDKTFVLAGSEDVTQDIIRLLSNAMGERA
jgi:hypothetical protein